jgi:hypothetical protein
MGSFRVLVEHQRPDPIAAEFLSVAGSAIRLRARRFSPDTLERRRQEERMIVALYVAAAVIDAVGSLYLAWRYRNFRKFLAGAFFVSSGILFYLYLADVSVPLLGTNFVSGPRLHRRQC